MQRKASLLALGISLVAASILLWMLGKGALGETRAVVVLTRDVAPGVAITRAMLDFRDLPEAYVEERHVSADSVERVVGMRANASVTSGAALLWTDLETAHAERAMSGLVQVGMRALSLPLREIGAERWLKAGDRVDLLFTPRVPEDGTLDEQPSMVVLENALVLAVRPVQERGEDPGEVTLSVNPREALRIVHTQGRGALRITLRNPHDVAVAGVFDDGRGVP